MLSAWSEVKVLNVDAATVTADVGEERRVSATVRLGSLDPKDVSVQLAHGAVGANGELVNPSVDTMGATTCEDGTCSYSGSFVATAPGPTGSPCASAPRTPTSRTGWTWASWPGPSTQPDRQFLSG